MVSIMFRCTRCRQEFTSARDLQWHELHKVHYDWACPLCPGKTFQKKQFLETHRKVKHPSQILHCCPRCIQTFTSEDALKDHYRNDPIHPSCPVCSDVFENDTSLSVHKTSMHPILRCETCAESYYEEQRDQHCRNSPNHPNCTVCGVGCETNASYQRHALLHHPEYCCSTCGIVFSSSALVEQHYLDSDVHPTCAICNIGFRTNAEIQTHNTSEHRLVTPPPPVVSAPSPRISSRCALCSRNFGRPSDLQAHYRDSPRHRSCVTCRIGFKDEISHQEHMASVHTPTSSSSTQTVVPEVDHNNTGLSVRSSPPVNVQTILPYPLPEPRPEWSPATPRSDVPEIQQRRRTDSLKPINVSPRACSEPTPSPVPVASVPQQLTPTSYGPETSVMAEEATIVTQASAPTSPAVTHQSLSYVSVTSTPDLTTSPSLSISSISPSSNPQLLPPIQTVIPRYAPSSQFSVQERSDFNAPMSASYLISQTDLIPSRISTPTSYRPTSRRSAVMSPHTSAAGGAHQSERQASEYGAQPTSERSRARSHTSSRLSRQSVQHQSSAEVRSAHTEVPTRISPTVRANAGSKPHSTMSSGRSETVAATVAPTKSLMWHCRLCLKEPFEPTVTMCGHLFCHGCIIQELAQNFQCPVCKKVMLLRLNVDHL